MTDETPKRKTESIETDVIVLGVGTCGEDLSLRLLGAGLDVVGIEAALVGGECAYWACLPTKRLIRVGNMLQEGRRANGLAGRTSVEPDWSMVAERLRAEVTGNWDDSGAVARYTSRGGRLIHGRGRLTGRRTVEVNGQTVVALRGIVIATGSRPAIPPIPGLAQVDYWTTHDVINAESLPASLVILGGGAVGCELGQLLSRFGVRVSIVEAAERLLAAEEPEASTVLAAALAACDIAVHTVAAAERVSQSDGLVTLHLSGGREVTGERLLVATGRRVDLSELGLESAGLDGSARFLRTDDRQRVADGIWAMGDVTGVAMFTHVALYQSAIIAAGILGKSRPAARCDALPRVVFTDPEVAAVGLGEAAARAAGVEVAVIVKQLPATFRGWLDMADGVIKLVVDRQAAVLVGATVVGPRAAEMLGILGLAIHAKIPLTQLRSMIYPFPTFYGSIGEAMGAYGRGLSTVMDPGYAGFELLDAVDTAITA